MSIDGSVQFLPQEVHADELVVLRSSFWHFNAIGLRDGESACVIDPGIYPHEIDALQAALTDNGRRTVEFVVLTHSHHDHIRAWSRFGAAQVVMPQVAAEKDAGARARIMAAKSAIDRKLGIDDADFDYPSADIVFERQLSLRVGTLELELRFLPGHSNCTSVVWIPRLRALCSADYLVSPGLPYCRWRAREFEAALVELRRFCVEHDVQRVLPSHNDCIVGQRAILAAIDEERAYFEFVRAEVRTALARGESAAASARLVARRVAERRGTSLGGKERQDVDNVRRVIAEEQA